MIDLMPNETFFVQLGIFLVTLFCLNFLVFQPVLRILKRRQELTEGAEAEAARLGGETEALMESYQQKIQTARGQGIKIKDELIHQGEGQANELLGKARKELEQDLEKNRQEVARQAKEAQLILRKHTRDLSQEMAEKLLGRKIIL